MRIAIGAVMLCSFLSAGCAPSLQQAREARADGQLLRAEKELIRFKQGDQPTQFHEAQKLLQAVKRERQTLTAMWTARAFELDEVLRDTSVGHLETLQAYEAVASLLPAGSSAAAAIDLRRRGLKEELRQAKHQFEVQVHELRRQSDSCPTSEFIGAMEGANIQRVSVGGDAELVSIALRASRQCIVAGQHQQVEPLTMLAKRLRCAPKLLPISALHREMLASLHGAATVQRAATVQHDKARTENRQASTQTIPKKAGALEKAVSLFEHGEHHKALVTLIAFLAKNEEHEEATSLSRKWQKRRDALVTKYLDMGEEALRQERPTEAFKWYALILELQPQHPLAKDRLRKLEALERLRNKSR